MSTSGRSGGVAGDAELDAARARNAAVKQARYRVMQSLRLANRRNAGSRSRLRTAGERDLAGRWVRTGLTAEIPGDIIPSGFTDIAVRIDTARPMNAAILDHMSAL